MERPEQSPIRSADKLNVSRHLSLGVIVASVAATATLGCPLLADLEELGTRAEAGASSDSAGGDGRADASLNCSSTIEEPGRQSEVSARFVTASQLNARVSVRLCEASDPLCGAPRELRGGAPFVAGPEAGLGFVSYEGAAVVGTVSRQFHGFFEAVGDPYVRTFRYFAVTQPKFGIEQLAFRLEDVSEFADRIRGRQKAQDLVGHGLVLLYARSCEGLPLAGLTFETTAQDSELVKFTFTGPNVATSDDVATLSLGAGGFLNVPPGEHTFRSKLVATGQVLGSVRVFIRAEAVTAIDVFPGGRGAAL